VTRRVSTWGVTGSVWLVSRFRPRPAPAGVVRGFSHRFPSTRSISVSVPGNSHLERLLSVSPQSRTIEHPPSIPRSVNPHLSLSVHLSVRSYARSLRAAHYSPTFGFFNNKSRNNPPKIFSTLQYSILLVYNVCLQWHERELPESVED
jgi:hypothetical protein